MLSIVAELKRGLLLGNFPAMIENTRDRLRTLSDVQQGVDLGHLQAELSEAILETEAEMYRV